MPAWETNFQIPFSVEDFIIGEEIVNDSTIIIKDGDPNSVIWVSLTDSVELQTLSNRDLSIKLNEGFDFITLDTLTVDTLEIFTPPPITLRSLLPELSQLTGQTVTVEATTIEGLPITLQSGVFKRVHFLAGRIRIRVSNNLPFDVGPNSTSSGLQATVVSDSLPNNPFTEVLFPETIPAGQSAIQEVDISNKWLFAPLGLTFEFPIAQASTHLITDDLLDNSRLSVTIELLDIKTDEIVAALKPQRFDGSIKLGLNTKDQFREAEIDRGRIFLDLTSNVNLKTNIRYIIPALRNADDQPFIDSFTIPANGTMQRTLILDGFRAANTDAPGEIIDSLEIEFLAETQFGSEIVRIRGSDNISVNVTSDSIYFKSISGIIDEELLIIDPVIEDDVFDYGDFDGDVDFSDVCLEIRVFSEIAVENLIANLRFTAHHKDDRGVITESAQFALNQQQINGGQPGSPAETRIFLNGIDRPELLDMIEILPTTLEVRGTITASGEAAVTAGDRMWATYIFETPIKAKINSIAAFEGDVNTITEVHIDSLIRDAAEENILGADIHFKVTNRTPLSGAVCFVLSADNSDPDIYDAIFDTSLVIVDTIAVAPAPVDPLTGFVNEAREMEITLHLNQREVQLFQDVPLRYGYEFIVDETQDFVTLRYSDFVRLRGAVDTRVLIEDN